MIDLASLDGSIVSIGIPSNGPQRIRVWNKRSKHCVAVGRGSPRGAHFLALAAGLGGIGWVER